MTKTTQLLADIKAGKRRINSIGTVDRLASTGEWVTDPQWRADVVLRVRVLLDKQPLRERLCTPVTVGQAAIAASTVR